jgi:LacI family transcriptional regulator
MSSVSRVLSGHPDVSADMRKRVVDAVAQLGYEPDFLRRASAAERRSRGVRRRRHLETADGRPRVPARRSCCDGPDYSMLVMNSENDPALDARTVRFFQSRRVDGMILSLASERKKQTLDLLGSASPPWS